MNKIDLILKLVRDNKITDEEAKLLMVTEKEYVYYPSYPYYWNPQPYTITYGSSSTGDYTITPNGTITSYTSN